MRARADPTRDDTAAVFDLHSLRVKRWLAANGSSFKNESTAAMTKTPSQIEAQREHDQRRAIAQPWRKMYATPKWRALRAQQLARVPVCQRCFDDGLTKAATVVHHVRRHQGDPALFFDAANLASSCKQCHDSTEATIEHGNLPKVRIGDDGWPVG